MHAHVVEDILRNNARDDLDIITHHISNTCCKLILSAEQLNLILTSACNNSKDAL